MPRPTKELQIQYQREWMAKRRAKWLSDKGPCVKCGSYQDLEIDHINPEEKSHRIIWSYKKEILDKELAKCQILCSSCHQEKSNEYTRKLFSGIPKPELQTIPDSAIIKVRELVNSGISERKACKIVGIKRGSYSSMKAKGLRKHLFS